MFILVRGSRGEICSFFHLTSIPYFDEFTELKLGISLFKKYKKAFTHISLLDNIYRNAS